MADPWDTDEDTSHWDATTQDYSSQAERDEGGQTLDESWEYQTDDYGYTKQDNSQTTGYKEARKTEIKRIQTALLRATFNPGTIDGSWGPKTCSAMLAFQKSRFGSAKKAWLDIETWTKLDFDMSTSKRFEDLYGRSCGGTPPAGWTGAGSGTNVGINTTEIQKIQYGLGVLTTGVFDAATCAALYKKQAALGVSGSVLTKHVFETLGFTTSDAQKLATQLGTACTAYYKAAGGTTPAKPGGGTTTPTKPPTPKPPTPAVKCATGYSAVNGKCTFTGCPIGYVRDSKGVCVQQQTAGLSGWWILAGMLVVGVGGMIFMKDQKPGKRRR
jgi:peptidoglycan hydrolase-like protein with peptidoglycan-binding domain